MESKSRGPGASGITQINGYPETDMCARCLGECCRRQPGHCLPSEFGSTEDLRAALLSGRYAIILLMDSHITARVIRPHYKEPDRQKGCTFHHAKGCELPLPDRPYGCRMLLPRERDDGHCEPKGVSIEEAARMWEESGYLPPLWAGMGPGR